MRNRWVGYWTRPRDGPGTAWVFLLEPHGEIVGAAVLLELADRSDDLMERTGMFFLVLAVEQVGMEIGE